MKSTFKALVEQRRMSFVDDPETEKHLKMVAKWLVSPEMKPSLLMFGGLGNGKTTMSLSIARSMKAFSDSIDTLKAYTQQAYNESIEHLKTENYWRYIELRQQKPADIDEAEKMRAHLPGEVKLTSAQALADLAGTNKDELDKIKRCQFLVIDDLGCEPAEVKVYGTAITPVVDILYYRYDTLMPTVITTNLDKTKIRDTYGFRVADRLEEMCESIAFTNNTYRR